MSDSDSFRDMHRFFDWLHWENPPIAWMHPTTKAEMDAKAGDEAPMTHVFIGTEKVRHEIRVSDEVPIGIVPTDKARLTTALPSQHSVSGGMA